MGGRDRGRSAATVELATGAAAHRRLWSRRALRVAFAGALLVATLAVVVLAMFPAKPHALLHRAMALLPQAAVSRHAPPVPVWWLKRIGPRFPGGIAEFTFGLALSPDGHTIATAGDRLQLWNADTGKQAGASLAVSGQRLAWRPDGAALAVGTKDGRVVLVAGGTLHVLWQTAVGQKPVFALAFSPDGRRIAASSMSDNTFRMLDVKGKVVCEAPPIHLKTLTGLAFAEGGNTLVSSSLDGTIRTWDPASCKPRGAPVSQGNTAYGSLVVNPDGKTIAVSARIATGGNAYIDEIEFRDLGSGKMVAPPLKGEGGTYGINGLAFTADGDRLMFGASPGVVSLMDWRKGRLLARGVAEHDAVIVWATAFSPGGDLVATAGKDGVLGIWKAQVMSADGAPLALSARTDYTFDGTLPMLSDDGRVAAFTRDGHFFVRADGSVRELTAAAVKDRVSRLALSPDGRWLFADGMHAHLWQLQTGHMTGELNFSYAEAAAFNAGGTRVAMSFGSIVHLVDCLSGKEILHYQIGGNPNYPRVLQLAFDPANRLLLAGTSDGVVYRLDASTLAPRGAPWPALTRNGVFAFSPDGRRVAVARRLPMGEMTQVLVLDAASGAQLSAPMQENLGWVPALAFTPDGNHLLMAGRNGTVSLWDTTSGQSLARTSAGSLSNIRDVRITRDLQRLYACESGTYTKTACHSWDITLHVPAAARAGAPPLLLPPGKTTSTVTASLSGAIDLESSKLSVPEPDGLVFVTAGGVRLLGTPRSAPGNGQPAATVYADSALSADGSLVTVRLNGDQLGVFDFHDGTMLSLLKAPGAYAFLADGTLALDRDLGILIVDPKTGRKLRTLGDPVQGVVSLMTAGARRPILIVGTADGTLLIGRTDSPAAHFTVLKHVHSGAVQAVAFSSDERLLASGGADGQIHLFDVATGKPATPAWTAHGDAVTALGFNADGTLLAAGSADGTLRLFDVKTGHALTIPLIAHVVPVLGVAFDPAGRLLSFGGDATMRIWTLGELKQ